MTLRLQQDYHILGLPTTASLEGAKQRYRALAFSSHPDRNVGQGKQAKVKFQAVWQAYEHIEKHHRLMSKPLPSVPVEIKLEMPLSSRDIALPLSPIESPSEMMIRKTVKRKPVPLCTTSRRQGGTLPSPMPPPVPLKIRRFSSTPSIHTTQSQSPPKSPRRIVTMQTFSVTQNIVPFAPTRSAVSKKRPQLKLSAERSICDIRASIFSTLSHLQTTANATLPSSTKPMDDAMYATLQRLKRRMLNGRHRTTVHSGPAGVQHWTELEKRIDKTRVRSYEVDVKRKIDLRGEKRRMEIVGMLNAWEEKLRESWTNDF